MKLTENFSLNELVVTSTGLVNSPSRPEIENLKILCEKVLQPLRDLYADTIFVSSGYRSPSVNRKVGGAKNSHHVFGMAADLKCKDNALLYNLIKDNFEFTQLIWEKGNDIQPAWVHVSYDKNNLKNQILRIK
jgi:zinc D-Ala-D-Ala carboxypeptidase